MNGMERLTRAESDAVELHKALSDAVQRIARANDLLGRTGRIDYEDLLEVLDRTGQTKSTLNSATTPRPFRWSA